MKRPFLPRAAGVRHFSWYEVSPLIQATISCLTVIRPVFPFGNIRFQLKLRKHAGGLRLNKKIEIFIWSRISKFLRPAQRCDDFKLITYLSSLNKRAKLLPSYLAPLGYSVPPALHRTIWCRSTFGPRGPGLSNPTSFLRPVLPMAPTRDDKARDKRSVLRPNSATFLRDFALYMKLKYAIIRKKCLNHTACLTIIRPVFPFGNIRFQLKLRKHAGGLRLI